MHYHDLRDFIQFLEANNQLIRIKDVIDPQLEITELSARVLKHKGPALLFEQPKNHTIPVLTNLFGTVERIAFAMGQSNLKDLRALGQILAYIKAPEPPKGMKELWERWPTIKRMLSSFPKVISNPECQSIVKEGKDVDLSKLPIQTCWPKDIAPLITWGLVITKNPTHLRQNLGIYRQQVLNHNQVIMRWLAHRGGALDYQEWLKIYPGKPFPVAVALGADPATTLAAVTPIPDDLSEYNFAGLLRGSRTIISPCLTHDLHIPASAEIILEGFIYPGQQALEGPHGDHTGYYNEQETFPVFTVEKITHRSNPIYHSTYTGKPPDEPAMLGVALNELLIPILQKQFPEIEDFYLPPEGCSYRLAILSIKKQYAGHAQRMMMAIWSFLKQFLYTKFIIICDNDINIRDWKEVIWAITTRVDPARDSFILNNSPIDYLDFASPQTGLGSKIGFDATNKWPGETSRQWGTPIHQDPNVVKKIDAIWEKLLESNKTLSLKPDEIYL